MFYITVIKKAKIKSMLHFTIKVIEILTVNLPTQYVLSSNILYIQQYLDV